MRGIEFVSWGFVILTTLVAGTVLPYFVLYVVRGRQRVGCGIALVVVLVAIAIGFGIGMVLRPAVVAQLSVPRIQAALNAQCGSGSEEVRAADFTTTPYYSWLGEEAGCQYIDYTTSWECYCGVDAP